MMLLPFLSSYAFFRLESKQFCNPYEWSVSRFNISSFFLYNKCHKFPNWSMTPQKVPLQQLNSIYQALNKLPFSVLVFHWKQTSISISATIDSLQKREANFSEKNEYSIFSENLSHLKVSYNSQREFLICKKQTCIRHSVIKIFCSPT